MNSELDAKLSKSDAENYKPNYAMSSKWCTDVATDRTKERIVRDVFVVQSILVILMNLVGVFYF